MVLSPAVDVDWAPIRLPMSPDMLHHGLIWHTYPEWLQLTAWKFNYLGCDPEVTDIIVASRKQTGYINTAPWWCKRKVVDPLKPYPKSILAFLHAPGLLKAHILKWQVVVLSTILLAIKGLRISRHLHLTHFLKSMALWHHRCRCFPHGIYIWYSQISPDHASNQSGRSP